jgi:hypothetical protein
LVECRGDPVDESHFLGSEKDASGPRKTETAAPGQSAASSVVEEDEPAGALLEEGDGLGFSRVDRRRWRSQRAVSSSSARASGA